LSRLYDCCRCVKTEKQRSTLDHLRLVGQGREAEIFEWPNGRVLRLRRGLGTLANVAAEVSAVETARSAGVPAPYIYEQIVVGGRPGLVMDRLHGPDLLSVLGGKPWMVFRSGRVTGAIHAQINAARAAMSLPTVRDVMRRRFTRLAEYEPALAERV